MQVAGSVRSRWAIAAIGALLLLCSAVVPAAGEASGHRPPAPCGAKSAAAVADVDEEVAQRIYGEELSGHETLTDEGHVRDSQALLSALSSGSPAAVSAAVSALVYAPHWHIVRLRVLRDGRVVADIGGPYVIAPVTGKIVRHGRTLGKYVISVQDDLGYEKLVSRFIDVPVELYRGHTLVMGTLTPAPALPKSEAHVVVLGTDYRARVFAAKSFPEGTLEVALLVPLPSRSLSELGCGQLRADTWGSVAMRIAARLPTLSERYEEFVGIVRAASGASVFVRSGNHVIAGGRIPRHLPEEGAVRFDGATRWVFSWLAAPGVRVYVVAPA
jgi:hypothetical protein